MTHGPTQTDDVPTTLPGGTRRARPPRRNARGAATAARVERAAVLLVEEHGLPAVTVARICAAAGVSERTFFHHFATKEDAILGSAVPSVDEQAAREWLADPQARLLTGVLGVVGLPDVDGEPEVRSARLRAVAASPELLLGQAQRLAPLEAEVRGLIELKLASLGVPAERRPATAAAVATLAAALLHRGALAVAAGEAVDPRDEARSVVALLGDLGDRLF